jgi:hypothetical protein
MDYWIIAVLVFLFVLVLGANWSLWNTSGLKCKKNQHGGVSGGAGHHPQQQRQRRGCDSCGI